MPGVQQPTYGGGYGQPSGYSSGGYQAGAQPPSGGYTAQRRAPQGTDSSDRMTLMIAIGVVAVALLIILVALIFRSREAGAYTSGVKHDFVSKCAAQTGNTEPMCQCTMDKIEATVDFEDFKAFGDAVDDDPDATRPQWLLDAVDACNATEQPTST
jgi:hypothetical protein